MPRRLPVVNPKSVPLECARCTTVLLIPPLAWLLASWRLRSWWGLRCPVCRDRFPDEDVD